MNTTNCGDIFQAIGGIFNPADYNCVESGFSNIKWRNTSHHHEDIEAASYEDYSIDELVACIYKQLESTGPGEKIYVDMGISILSARVILDSENYYRGDRNTPPYAEQFFRLENVNIIEEDGRHRRLEEIAISKMIF